MTESLIKSHTIIISVTEKERNKNYKSIHDVRNHAIISKNIKITDAMKSLDYRSIKSNSTWRNEQEKVSPRTFDDFEIDGKFILACVKWNFWNWLAPNWATMRESTDRVKSTCHLVNRRCKSAWPRPFDCLARASIRYQTTFAWPELDSALPPHWRDYRRNWMQQRIMTAWLSAVQRIYNLASRLVI